MAQGIIKIKVEGIEEANRAVKEFSKAYRQLPPFARLMFWVFGKQPKPIVWRDVTEKRPAPCHSTPLWYSTPCCDKCDQPAMHTTQDVNITSGFPEPLGWPRHGCMEHTPDPSEVFNFGLHPPTRKEL